MSTDIEGVVELPDGEGKVPGVVVIHEYWGVNDQIKKTLKRWTEEGFVAVAPDLFHGKVTPTGDHASAGAMLEALDWPAAVKQVADAVAFLKSHPRCNGKVAVTGYCM